MCVYAGHNAATSYLLLHSLLFFLVIRVEEEAKLGETVRAIDSCDSELEQLKSSIEIHRSKISTLEAEAGLSVSAFAQRKLRIISLHVAQTRRRCAIFGPQSLTSDDACGS